MPPAKMKVQKLARSKRYPRGSAAKTAAEAAKQIARFREAHRDRQECVIPIDQAELQKFQNQCADRRRLSAEAEDRRRARAEAPFTAT